MTFSWFHEDDARGRRGSTSVGFFFLGGPNGKPARPTKWAIITSPRGHYAVVTTLSQNHQRCPLALGKRRSLRTA